jgi:hypothetical protein
MHLMWQTLCFSLMLVVIMLCTLLNHHTVLTLGNLILSHVAPEGSIVRHLVMMKIIGT